MKIRFIIKESSSKVIDISVKGGDISGVIHYQNEFIENWISMEKLIPFNYVLPVAIIKNINVDPKYRGKGIGNKLMDKFFSAAEIANTICLIADTYEENLFNLVEWYESFGFEVVDLNNGCPLMIMEGDI